MNLPDHVIIFILFILGASFGSFLNVVIYRVPEKMSLIKPASHCESCKTPIKPWDNIPILSYFILGGKCRNCGAPFSLRYPLIEALTATNIWGDMGQAFLPGEYCFYDSLAFFYLWNQQRILHVYYFNLFIDRHHIRG